MVKGHNYNLSATIADRLTKEEFISKYKGLIHEDLNNLYEKLVDENGGSYKLSRDTKKSNKRNRKQSPEKSESIDIDRESIERESFEG